MGQSRPLFVYFRSFLITISIIQIEKSVDGVLGIQTLGRRMVGADKATELWRPPYLCWISVVPSCCRTSFYRPSVPHWVWILNRAFFITFGGRRKIENVWRQDSAQSELPDGVFNTWAFATATNFPAALKFAQVNLKLWKILNKPSTFPNIIFFTKVAEFCPIWSRCAQPIIEPNPFNCVCHKWPKKWRGVKKLFHFIPWWMEGWHQCDQIGWFIWL